jgi:hypothetical protein
MKSKFSRNFFSSKEEYKAAEPIVPASKEEFSKKYSQKEAGSRHHYIQQEIKDVHEEIHGDYAYEDDFSEEDLSPASRPF